METVHFHLQILLLLLLHHSHLPLLPHYRHCLARHLLILTVDVFSIAIGGYCKASAIRLIRCYLLKIPHLLPRHYQIKNQHFS